MSCDLRSNIRSAPESVIPSKQTSLSLHLPPISPTHPPRTSPQPAYPREHHLTHSRISTSSSYDIIFFPHTPNDVTDTVSMVQDEVRLEQLWQWIERYRDWQIQLMLAVIAQFSKLHIIHSFNTVLLPFLGSAKYNTFLDRTNGLTDTSLSRSLSLTPYSGRRGYTHINISHLPLSVHSSDFFPQQEIPKSYMERRHFKRIKRPKTGILVGEFRSELQMIGRYMSTDWCSSLLQIRFLCELVKRCSISQLQFFAGCLRKRLSARLDIACLSDSLLMRIFSFLDPPTLSQVTLVSKRWKELAMNPVMWRNKVRMFGAREGVPNLDECVEQGELGLVGWREAYIQLENVFNSLRLGTALPESEKLPQQNETLHGDIELHTKLLTRADLDGMRDNHGHVGEKEVLTDDAESPLKVEKEEKHKVEKKRKRRVAESSKTSQLPIIAKSESSKRATKKQAEKKDTKPIKSPSPRKRQPPKIYGREVIWKVFDFIHFAPTLRTTEPPGISSKFYTYLALAGCIPSSLTCNQAVKLPPPIYPIRSVRLFTQVPPIPLFSVACDSRRVLVSGADLCVRLYDCRSGREFGCLEGHKGVVSCIALLGHLVLTGAWDCTVVVWDAVHLEAVHTIHAHSQSVARLAVEDNFLVSGSDCGEVSVWRVDTWELVSALELHSKRITGLCFSKHQLCTSSLDGKVGVWDTASWKLVTAIDHTSPITCMAVRLGLCVTGCASGFLRFWNLSSCKEEMCELNTCNKLSQHLKSQNRLSTDFTAPSPIYAVSIAETYVFATNSNAICQWSLVTCSLVRVLLAHDAPISCLAGDKHKLVSVGEDGRVVLWHTRSKPHTLSNYPNSMIVFGDIKRIQL